MTTTSNETNQTNMLKKIILQTQSFSPLFEKTKMEKSSPLWLAGIMMIAFVIAAYTFSAHEEATTFTTNNGRCARV